MTEDLTLKVGGDFTPLTKELDKLSKKKINIPYTSYAKGASYERAKELSKYIKQNISTSSSYQSQKGTGRLDQSIGVKPLSEAFRIGYTSVSKKHKMELWWKWLKGSYTSLLKFSPLMKSFLDIISAILGILATAILLPFLEDILGVLTFLLNKSIQFFDWMEKNKEGVRAAAEIGLGALLAGLGLSGIIKAFTWVSGIILKMIPGWQTLSKILAPVIAWLGEKGLGGALKSIITWVAKFVDPLLWASLIADISKYIFGWVQTWSDNPIWQTFWGGMAGLASIVSDVVDVFGWIINIFTGKGFDRIGKIGQDIVNFGDGIKQATGFSGSIMGGDLKVPWGADGGVVTQPTIMGVGEAGAEAIIPLDRLGEFGGKGTTNITVSGIVDERKFREIIQSVVNQSMNKTYNVRGATY